MPHPLSSQEPLHITVAVRSDPGKQRSGPNQDSYLVALVDGAGVHGEASGSASIAWAALAVCDGMGGAAGGEVASRTAVDVIREGMRAGAGDDIARALVTSVQEASRRIHATQQHDRALAGMGTTTTACALAGATLFIAQVGDSRAYLLRDGELTLLTRDQTLARQLVELGQLTEEEAETFEYSNIILQAVGTQERVDVDLRSVEARAGDVLLVCSDGLHGVVRDGALREALLHAETPGDACDALIDLAYSKGAPDNVTCVVARIDALGAEPSAASCPVAVSQVVLMPLPPEDDVETNVADPETDGSEAPSRSVFERVLAFFGA